jgi:segregation and condensation protein B
VLYFEFFRRQKAPGRRLYQSNWYDVFRDISEMESDGFLAELQAVNHNAPGFLNSTAVRAREKKQRLLAFTNSLIGAIDLRRTGGGWRFYTHDAYAPYVERFLLDGQRARLTRAALETLAVVAYRQPVTRTRVSAVRGVNCDGVLRTLLTRGLVQEVGTEPATQGILFATTELFLERLGLTSLADLPPLAPLLPDIDAIDEL